MTDYCYGTDYQKKFDPEAFLTAYCTDDSFWVKEGSIIPTYHEIFSSLDFTPDSKLLEFGSGPTIYAVVSASDKFEEITLAEYADGNREALSKWLERKEGAHDWTPTLAVVGKLEGKSPCQIEDRVRSAIKNVISCDINQKDFLPAGHMGPYNFIISNLCLDAACKTVDDYKVAVKKLSSCLKPGGGFILSGMVGCSFYHVGNQKFFSLPISQEDVVNAVKEAGLLVHSWKSTHLDVLEGANDHSGFIVVYAKKA